MVLSGRLDMKAKPRLVTWLIDGNNLQCCSGGRKKERQEIIQEIGQIASSPNTTMNDGSMGQISNESTISNVVLVFDGNEDESLARHVENPWFQIIVTDGKMKQKDRADDFIVHVALPEISERFGAGDALGHSVSHVVHLVSADRKLAKRVRGTRLTNGGSIVQPAKFWKQYLPNLQQRQV